MLKGDGNKNRIKINRSNLRKNKLARTAHFFVHFFAVVLHDLNVKLPSYLLFFRWNCRVCSPKILLLGSCHFYFFTAAHFHIASISHFLTAAMKCSRFFSDEIRLLCFQSLTLALT